MGSHSIMDRKIDCIDAAAKLNLFLKVTAKRADGYHELLTLFVPLAAPSDSIMLEDSGTLEVICAHPQIPNTPDNICYKTAVAYAKAAGIKPDWKITITKNIPVAAGMGGGSSDAAALLQLLNKRCGALRESDLAEIAVKLGADVPFFLNPQLAVAEGIGEKIRGIPGNFPLLPLVIVNPVFPVSAGWAYQHLNPVLIHPADAGALDELLSAWAKADFAAMSRHLHNDLAVAVLEKFPLLGIIQRSLLDSGALGAAMTGSGPTIFAICADSASADCLAAAMRDIYPDFEVLSTTQA
jgi:4-diphosphocytidyl-2-C-methyl-D-erythritol kinase